MIGPLASVLTGLGESGPITIITKQKAAMQVCNRNVTTFVGVTKDQ